jgi:hypothetical protein
MSEEATSTRPHVVLENKSTTKTLIVPVEPHLSPLENER